MPDFTLRSGGYIYRPLKKGQQGWDIFALQTALKGAGSYSGDLDGLAGPITHSAIVNYQTKAKLVADGIAGIVTQRSLAIKDMDAAQTKYVIPAGALKGQIETESGFILGNHSPQYSNGAWDAGVAQRNSVYTPLIEGFDVPASLDALGKRLRDNYNKYKGYGKVTGERRLWELAQGSWNAPAWTDTLARGGTLSTANRQWIEDYIDRVTVYLEV